MIFIMILLMMLITFSMTLVSVLLSSNKNIASSNAGLENTGGVNTDDGSIGVVGVDGIDVVVVVVDGVGVVDDAAVFITITVSFSLILASLIVQLLSFKMRPL